MALNTKQDTQKPMGLDSNDMYNENREKHWSEIAIEEKIERLRNLVKSLVLTTDSQRSELNNLRSFIWDHAHEENGSVIVKIKKEDRYRLNGSEGMNIVNKAAYRDEQNDEVYI